jgi:hypothetical protein
MVDSAWGLGQRSAPIHTHNFRTISGVRFLLPAGGDARSFPDRIVDFTEVQFRAVFDQASRLCVERGPYALRPLLTDLGETAAG